MKFKKICAMLLSGLISLSLFTGCGNGSTASAESSQEPSPTPTPVCDSVRIVLPGTAPEKLEEGLKAVNDKLVADGVNQEISITYYDESIYADKIELLVNSDVGFELFFTANEDFASYVKDGVVSDISSELKAVSGFTSLFSDELWNTATVNKKIYGVPLYLRENNGADYGFFVNNTIASKAGAQISSADAGELADYLKSIKGESDISCLVTDPDGEAKWLYGLSDSFPFSADDELGLVSVDSEGKVSSFLKSNGFKNTANNYKTLNESGLISGDIVSNTDISEALSSGKFISISGDLSKIAGYDFGSTDLSYVNLSSANYIGKYDNDYLTVPKTSENTKGVLEFINWLYSSQENYDLFEYGTKGSDYELTDSGRVKSKDGAYSQNTALTGYLPLMRYSETVAQAYIDAISVKAENLTVSDSANFRFDSSAMEETIRRLKIAVETYVNPIKYGISDYDDNIDSAIEELNKAGLNDYIEEYQKQYTAFLSADSSKADAGESSVTESSAEESESEATE